MQSIWTLQPVENGLRGVPAEDLEMLYEGYSLDTFAAILQFSTSLKASIACQ